MDGDLAPNRTAELPNGEFDAPRAPALSELRSLQSLIPTSPELTCGYSAIISESEISLSKQLTSWRTRQDSNSRSG